MAEEKENGIFLLTADPALTTEVARFCEACDWICEQGDSAQAAIDAARAGIAIVMIDDRVGIDRATETIENIRALPGFAGGTPVIQCGEVGGEAVPGARARIVLPLTPDPFRAAIEQWAGPMDARAMRRENDPRYRLIRLIGRDAAEPMLDRFASALDEALTHGDVPKDEAHRLAGLAGMLGFAQVSETWSIYERAACEEAPEALNTARSATRACLCALRTGK